MLKLFTSRLKCNHSSKIFLICWCSTTAPLACSPAHSFSVVLFVMLYKVILTFPSVDWDSKVWPFKWKLPSSTFLWYCLLCCATWFSDFSLWSVNEIPKCDHSNKSYTEHSFSMVQFIMLYNVVITFHSVDEILKCGDHSNERYWVVLFLWYCLFCCARCC